MDLLNVVAAIFAIVDPNIAGAVLTGTSRIRMQKVIGMSDSENRAMANSSVILLLVFAALVVLVGLSFAIGGGGMMGGAMGLGMLVLLLPLVLLIWLVLVFSDQRETRRPEPPFHPGRYGEYPLQILDRKYSSGEMTYQEYITLRDEIVRKHGFGPDDGR